MLNTSRLGSGALQQRCWSTASKAKRKDRASLCTWSSMYWISCYCHLISCVRMLPFFCAHFIVGNLGAWQDQPGRMLHIMSVTWKALELFDMCWCFSMFASMFAMSAKKLPPYCGECCSFHDGPPTCIASCRCILYIQHIRYVCLHAVAMYMCMYSVNRSGIWI